MKILILLIVSLAVGGGVYLFFIQDQASNKSAEPTLTVEESGETMEKNNKATVPNDDSDSMEEVSTEEEKGNVMEKDQPLPEPRDEKGDEEMKNENTGKQVSFSGTALAGTSSPLIDFNEKDYQSALASGKPIVLYFYADWCPLCKAEQPALFSAFDELSHDGIIGFRVNYNDSFTDNAEKDLAREHGVAYQHTKVFIKNGKRVLKSPETWSKERYLTEIANLL